MKSNKLLLFTLSVLLSSCAIAPFSNQYSAKTLGQGGSSFVAGNVASNYYLQFAYGLSKSTDIGFLSEFGDFTTSAVTLKQGIIQNDTGHSMAAHLSYGGFGEAKFYSLGFINSIHNGAGLEFFLDSRFNKIDTNSSEIQLDQKINGFKLKDYNASYFSFLYGANLWLTGNIGFSLYSTQFLGSDIEKVGEIFGVSLLLKY